MAAIELAVVLLLIQVEKMLPVKAVVARALVVAIELPMHIAHFLAITLVIDDVVRSLIAYQQVTKSPSNELLVVVS